MTELNKKYEFMPQDKWEKKINCIIKTSKEKDNSFWLKSDKDFEKEYNEIHHLYNQTTQKLSHSNKISDHAKKALKKAKHADNNFMKLQYAHPIDELMFRDENREYFKEFGPAEKLEKYKNWKS